MFPTLAEIETADRDLEAFFASAEPTVAEVLAQWCRVETAAFEAEDAARKAAMKPAVNVVTIATARTSADYKVTPFATSWGRGFTLQKIGGKKPESYDVLIGARGEIDHCDCGAAVFNSSRPCKHVLACRKLVADGMPVPAPKAVLTDWDRKQEAAYRW